MPPLTERDREAIREWARRRGAAPSFAPPRAPATNGLDRAVVEHRINDLSRRVYGAPHVEGAVMDPVPLAARVSDLEQAVLRQAPPRPWLPQGRPRGPF